MFFTQKYMIFLSIHFSFSERFKHFIEEYKEATEH